MNTELLVAICLGLTCLQIGLIIGLKVGWKDAKRVYGKDNPYVTDV
jgi:uncharacterized protein YneF (UPF0154 family)